MNESLIFLQNMGFALLLGGLIGIEREKRFKDSRLHEFGGIRTMSLISVFGYLSYALFGPSILFGILTGGFMLLVIAAYISSVQLRQGLGATTEMAAFFVYMVGVLMAMNEYLFATVTALTVLVLLYFKEAIHKFAHKIEKDEMYDTIVFMLIAFVVLPLLPNEMYGPLEVLNPYVIWFVVVLISSISFLSYIGIKFLGAKKGIGMGGFLGGLISSTAVSMTFSALSKKSKKLVNPFVFGILVASTAMFFRVLLEVFFLNPSLLPFLYLPMLSMGSAGILLSVFFWIKKEKSAKVKDSDLNFSSPFQLAPALKFGAVFAALLFISKFASVYYGDQGIYLTAFISGFMDVDAITVSMANLSKTEDISQMTAVTAITIATIVNTVTKGGIVLSFASKKVGWRVFGSMTFIALIGILSVIALSPLYYGLTTV
jgi:uncharacterized membrane protein (DUF4010 family)